MEYFEYGDPASLNKRRVNPLLFLFLLAALVLLWYRLRSMHPSYPVGLVSAAVLCYFLICSYSLNLVPRVSDSANNSILFTPALAIQRIVFSISLFASFGFFVGFYWFQAQTAIDTGGPKSVRIFVRQYHQPGTR